MHRLVRRRGLGHSYRILPGPVQTGFESSARKVIRASNRWAERSQFFASIKQRSSVDRNYTRTRIVEVEIFRRPFRFDWPSYLNIFDACLAIRFKLFPFFFHWFSEIAPHLLRFSRRCAKLEMKHRACLRPLCGLNR
jgi:hypothetical protein